MQDRKRVSTCVGLLLVGLLALAPRSASAAESEEQAVRRAVDGFYTSLNAMFQGDPKPAKAVWAHGDDVTFLGADGKFNVGWEQTYASWEKMAALKMGGQVRPTRVQVNLGQNLAVAHSYVTGAYEPGQQAEKVELRATSIFRKEAGSWKMIGHHADISRLLLEREREVAHVEQR